MSWYEYACEQCGLVIETQTFAKIGRPLPGAFCKCGGEYLRMVSLFSATPTPEPYFNYSLGETVTSDRDFKQKAKIASEKQSEYTGIQHDYQPISPGELASETTRLGVGVGPDKGESIEHSRRNNPNSYRPSKTKTII